MNNAKAIICYLGIFIISCYCLCLELDQEFHILDWHIAEQTQRIMLSSGELMDFVIFGLTGGLVTFSAFASLLLLIWGWD